ncbi:hypothetical protein CHUAL_000249 [Chamberlinius hualienensis]
MYTHFIRPSNKISIRNRVTLRNYSNQFSFGANYSIMVMFILSLVRHGETKANKEKIIQGQSDVPLSEVGLIQASHIALRLKNEKFTHVYSSDLSRASKTAETVAEKNRVIDHNTKVHLDERLRERKFGNVEGKTVNEMHQLAKESGVSFIHFNPKGAETVEDVRKRAISFFNDLCERCSRIETEEASVLNVSDKLTNVNICECCSQQGIKVDVKELVETSMTRNFEHLATIENPRDEKESGDSTLSEKRQLKQVVTKSNCSCNEKLVANVLLVSHGGFIRELIRYFVDELNCTLPGGKAQASLITPNTGLSVFKVSVSSTDVPKIMCLEIHNRNHLINAALFDEEAV